MFLGFYNYTTYLTYLNLMSGFCGIGFGACGKYTSALICLLISGFCDMFDGVVSRTKKNRSHTEKSYGIQIDSLADIISFGVLPIFINYSLSFKGETSNLKEEFWLFALVWLVWGFYLLAALIRLAYYNVLAETQKYDSQSPSYFTGLPVTAAAILFPFLFLAKFICKTWDFKSLGFIEQRPTFFWFHFACMLLLTFLFLCKKIHFPKPKAKTTITIILLLALNFILFMLLKILLKYLLPMAITK
ncbi:CDP-diacylglycerol-serine O-phosphatidyltransferase [Maize bushy stunt phytoplasma]|uniref:CDP-diacylglycerol-serine O-phosphatidyltransferase n=1 Tax=Maize bushy stunt phytoplasma TaxID=202462 RepID=A0ABN4RY39_9MOLU|nr:CDP-alcohol phosphatidyltransferase family protein [Maize bushy stunt phytoplasma]AOF54675.1 CDP-diacylglycerol-serine O-phosphatidyltransferase [Maize bushy stunt phytoplasma]